jgi:hypothetical protein
MDILRAWRPQKTERECFVRNDELKMYGTIDVIFHEPKVSLIMDYKNRKPPKALREEIRRSEYTTVNLGKYTPEGAFYTILYLTKLGYRFDMKDGKMDIFSGETYTPKAIDKVDYGFLYFGEHGNSFPNYYIA